MKKAPRESFEADSRVGTSGLEVSPLAVNSINGRVLNDFRPMERGLVPKSDITQD